MALFDKEVVSTLCSELNSAMDTLDDIVSSEEEEFLSNRHIKGSAKYPLLVSIEVWDILITDRDDIAEYAKNILAVLNNSG